MIKPELSVVMAVYNGERFLKQAIESVLNQTFKNFEFIIVNDGSTDKSKEIINSYPDPRIVLINQSNKGLANSLNIGIDRAKTEFIARMDADDICMKNRFQCQLEVLGNDKNLIAVGSNAIEITENGKYIFTSNQITEPKLIHQKLEDSLKAGKPWMPFYHSSTLFRKAVCMKAGGYDSRLRYTEDVVLFNKMSKYGFFINIEEPLIRYRIVKNSMSTRVRKDMPRFRKLVVQSINEKPLNHDDLMFLKNITSTSNLRSRKSQYHFYLSKKYLFKGRNKYNSLLNGLKCILLSPFFLKQWIILVALLLPHNLLKKYYGWLRYT
ncbi:MAG: glycosyltransferase family 2 protein [Bacteroidota bacterium]